MMEPVLGIVNVHLYRLPGDPRDYTVTIERVHSQHINTEGRLQVFSTTEDGRAVNHVFKMDDVRWYSCEDQP